MTDYVRVRVQESGHETIVPRSTAENLPGLEVLGDAENYDGTGRLPAEVFADSQPAYADRTVAELSDIIAARNADRDDAYLITPDGKTKDALVEALDADDARPVPERIIQANIETPRPDLEPTADASVEDNTTDEAGQSASENA